MRIINKEGTLQLNRNTVVEIERTNPFFTEWGEQSLPVTVPDTPRNKEILGHPERIQNKNKVTGEKQATIIDGSINIDCKQTILTAKKKDGYQLSFFLNEGAFFLSMPDTPLSQVFADETVAGVSTVEQGIAFCSDLVWDTDERFAICPIRIESDEGTLMYLNRLQFMDEEGNVVGENLAIPGRVERCDLYHAYDRTMIIDDQSVRIAAGYHIAPFLRVRYVLERIFQHFGYTFIDTEFTSSSSFKTLIFLHSCVDVLANGVIRFADLLPHVDCKAVLDILRKKFDAEFIPDEKGKTVQMVLFKDVIEQTPAADLSSFVRSELEIEYVEEYQRVKLTSSEAVDVSTSNAGSFASLDELLQDRPTAVLDVRDMNFYRIGFLRAATIRDRVCHPSLPYIDTDADPLAVKEITIDDSFPVMVPSDDIAELRSNGKPLSYVSMIFAGKARHLYTNSKYTLYTGEDSEEQTSTSEVKQGVILAHCYNFSNYDNGYTHATLSAYDFLADRKVFDFSLCYFGSDGLFEQFYRSHDTLMRNSLNTIRCEMILSDSLKVSLPSHRKIFLFGSEVLLQTLRYTLGDGDEPVESEFLSLTLYDPVSQATAEESRSSFKPELKWKVGLGIRDISWKELEDYNARAYSTFYPRHPLELGERMYTGHFYAIDHRPVPGDPTLITVYLEAILNT